MTEPYRRKILADMGIPSWRLRVEPGAQVEAPARPPPAPARPAQAGTAAIADTSPTVRPAGTTTDRRRARAENRADAGRHLAAAAPKPAAGAAAVESDTPWAVLSLVQNGVVLLVDGGCSRRDLRLARDILAAATGDWRAKPVRRLFQWPPELPGPGIEATADAGRRALEAFLDKDLADHRARLLLCAEPVGRRLESTGGGCPLVRLPSLHALGADPDAKQALWRTLAEARR